MNKVASRTLDDVVGEDNVNDDRSRQGAGMANNDVVDKNAGNDTDDDENQCLAKEVVLSWTYLNRGVQEKALTDQWNQDPGVSFCRIPGKHVEPITVRKGYVKSQ